MPLEKQKKLIIGRLSCLAVVILLFSVLQNTDGFFPRPFGASFLLLIPAVTSVAMHERETVGLFFGLFAGTLWDTSASGNNFYAIYLVLIGYICGLLIKNLLRSNIVTASLLSALSLLVFCLGTWLFRYVLPGLDSSVHILLRYYLPSFLLSVLISPVIYLIIHAIEKAFKTE